MDTSFSRRATCVPGSESDWWKILDDGMKLTDLRGILQYIPQFRDKTFILAIDGVIVTDESFATLLLDVALLWSLNIRVVLVHGAAAQIKSMAEAQHVTAS